MRFVSPDARHRFEPRTVMLVDDDPMILEMLARVLAGAGYRVVTHDSGFGLSHVVREHRPDLLLLDVSMPGLGGEGALAALRELARRFGVGDVPVIFLSGLPQERLAALARTHGAVGYLCKPASKATLLEAVARVVDDPTPSSAAR